MTANHRALEEIDIELIERVKLSPCLYDTRNMDFRLVYKKDTQWQNVAESLSMSLDEAKKRWTVLRDRYARELKQQQLNPNSEFGKNEFFCRMDFLRGFVKKRRERKKIGTLKLETQIVKYDYTVHPFETVHEQPQANMRKPVKGQELEIKYEVAQAYKQEEVVQDRHLDEIPESQGFQEFVDDSYETVIMENQDTSCNSSNSNAIHNIGSTEVKPSVAFIKSSNSDSEEKKPPVVADVSSDSEELFSRVIASYLKNLSRRYKIKAKVEMMQILEKYIDIEESEQQHT